MTQQTFIERDDSHWQALWQTPAGTQQGPHTAITDVELLTIRLGAIGTFEIPLRGKR